MAKKPAKHVRIGQVEEQTGLTRDTIHYYVREGLCDPPVKTQPNSALYSPGQVETLRRICALREAGLSIDSIRVVQHDPGLAGLSTDAIARLASLIVRAKLQSALQPKGEVTSALASGLGGELRLVAQGLVQRGEGPEELAGLVARARESLVDALDRALVEALVFTFATRPLPR
ncbi:MAG: helix-turn-helix domain-containing protein [Deltaproteobacteria bacterium]|nr:helix-turn-helix domain-containing protein [Deltaproteobacteria bacterium]